MREFYFEETAEYLPVIKECFATDSELLDKWHIEAPASLDRCVRRTFNDLKNAPTIKMFVIKCATEDVSEVVGFFGHEKAMGANWMTSFFIKPKYRDKETFSFFWNCVYDITGNEFFTAIYETNKRAKKFLEKNGFRLVQVTEMDKNINALVYQNN